MVTIIGPRPLRAPRLQITPTSSPCEQLCFPTLDLLQSSSDLSPPSHSTSSSRILTPASASPIAALFITASAVVKPACRHTTVPALLLKRSSHTVPHSPWMKTSTRPRSDRPSTLTSRTEPARGLLPPLPLLWPRPLPRGPFFSPSHRRSSRVLGGVGSIGGLRDDVVAFRLQYGARGVVNASGRSEYREEEVRAVWGSLRDEVKGWEVISLYSHSPEVTFSFRDIRRLEQKQWDMNPNSPTNEFGFLPIDNHKPAHEIPEDVESVEVGHLAASVDVASRHRLAQLVGVSEDRQDVV
ncbi:hypothetical protein EYF80_048067 [Liparis tanakae]|uniref:Uncharacterized protein n=1 Tax=Liparis tanakae TaxID=230148 RepID=A0A4Z2FKS2_9TELE|nr:hypothetical protein EYF80_048067 [Liparis tanakae]